MTCPNGAACTHPDCAFERENGSDPSNPLTAHGGGMNATKQREGTLARLRREHERGRCTSGQGHARHAGPDCLGCEVPWPCTDSLLLDVAEAARGLVDGSDRDALGHIRSALAALDTREAAQT